MLEKDLEEFIECNCPLYGGEGLCGIDDYKYDCLIHSVDMENMYFDDLQPSDTDHMCRIVYGIFMHESFDEIWKKLDIIKDVNTRAMNIEYINAHIKGLKTLFPNHEHIWKPDFLIMKAMKD